MVGPSLLHLVSSFHYYSVVGVRDFALEILLDSVAETGYELCAGYDLAASVKELCCHFRFHCRWDMGNYCMGRRSRIVEAGETGSEGGLKIEELLQGYHHMETDGVKVLACMENL